MSATLAWLPALDARIEREILRLRARYELSLDEFRGLYVSDEQVDQLIARAPVSTPGPPAVLDRPADGLGGSAERWRHLADVFALPPLEQDLLLIAAAPEIDLKYETLYAYLNNDVARKWPSADLAHRLLSDVASVDTIAAALAAGGRLHARHLIQRIDASAGKPALMNAGYALDACLTYWIHDQMPWLAFGSDAVACVHADTLEFDDGARDRAMPIARLLGRAAASGRGLPVVALLGQPGSGRTATAAALASLTGRPLVRVDPRVVDSDGDGSTTLDRLHVALSLMPAIVLLETADVPGDEDARRHRVVSRVARAISRWPASAFVLLRTSDDEPWRALAGARRAIEVRCDVGSYAARLATWRAAALAEAVTLPDADLHGLASRFALTPGHVRATLATARDLATMTAAGGAVASGDIAAAARLASDQAIGRLAMKVDRKHGWNDLVLPPATRRRLRELTAAIRHRHVVYDDWGFGDRVVTGVGIKALFAGASGTGKTMAAGVIARELGLDLYKIDLSGVVSKYIGETEKNLDRIFRAARSANAIVFLDEAEAIMGKRSEVKDAHDRYANIEVAYLLQRLEDHDGIVILATNLKRNIDDAFNRRMQYVVDFPRPEEAEREQIWRRMFPPQSPVAADVDFAFLARQFDLAGGDIRNVVLDAAFLAAEDGGTIDMRAIVEALARQLAKQGKTPTGTDFRQYQRLLTVAEGRHDGR